MRNEQSISIDTGVEISEGSKLGTSSSSDFFSIFSLSTFGIILLGFASIYVGELQGVTRNLEQFFSQSFSGFYAIMMNFYVITCIALALSPYGKIRLSPNQNDKPTFSTQSWLTMLFSAGMGIGLYFYGVVEPLTHQNFTLMSNVDGPIRPISLTVFHWGIHAWSCYGIIGLCFAYFAFRKNLPFTITSCLGNLLEHKDGFISKALQTTTVICPIVGIATTLGLGAMQITDGLAFSFGMQSSLLLEIAVIIIITIFSTLSVLSGLEKGMKYLSNFNITLAVVLLVWIFSFLSPLNAIFGIFSDLKHYVTSLPRMIIWTANHDYIADGAPFNWTTFRWSGWIAWTPFVGMFIAKISKGRTIREFLLGIVVFPTIVNAIWFSIIGRAGIETFTNGSHNIKEMINNDLSTTFFIFLSETSGNLILYGMVILSLKLFFITSSDSAAYVIATTASDGKNPSRSSKIYWSIVISLLSVVFLLSGGLGPMQIMNMASAAPFAVLSVFMIAHLVWNLLHDPRAKKFN